MIVLIDKGRTKHRVLYIIIWRWSGLALYSVFHNKMDWTGSDGHSSYRRALDATSNLISSIRKKRRSPWISKDDRQPGKLIESSDEWRAWARESESRRLRGMLPSTMRCGPIRVGRATDWMVMTWLTMTRLTKLHESFIYQRTIEFPSLFWLIPSESFRHNPQLGYQLQSKASWTLFFLSRKVSLGLQENGIVYSDGILKALDKCVIGKLATSSRSVTIVYITTTILVIANTFQDTSLSRSTYLTPL